MSIRFVLVLGLAVICGASAAVGTTRLHTFAGTDIPTVPVVVAKSAVSRGSMVDASTVELRYWPEKLVPEGALHSIDAVTGRSAIIPILAGDLILSAKLADKDSGRGLAPLIPDGMRAYTIQTSKLAANVAGFVLPGNRVDVLLTLKSDQNDGTGGGSSTTLLQSVEILATDQRLDAPADNKTADMRSVTLLVSPRQAAFLDLGQNLGQLTLSLRNPHDLVEGESEPATLADLRFHREPPGSPPQPLSEGGAEDAAAKPTTTTFKIRTLRGGHAGEVSVSKND